jgi:hypothetical protein
MIKRLLASLGLRWAYTDEAATTAKTLWEIFADWSAENPGEVPVFIPVGNGALVIFKNRTYLLKGPE